MPSYNAIDEITRLQTENQQLRIDKAELLGELYSLAFDEGVIKTDNILQAAADEIERLRHEFRELHRDISMFMDNGPLKQDLLETIADVLGEEK